MLTSSTLNWDTKNRATTYTYWDGSSASLPSANGVATARTAKQYKDLVKQVVTTTTDTHVLQDDLMNSYSQVTPG